MRQHRIGVNTAYLGIDSLVDYQLGCVEVCLGREGTFQENQEKVIGEMQRANALNIPLSVHLPVFLPEEFNRDYLDAMFLENDAALAELSFKMLELNLKALQNYEITYMVMHFPGVILNYENHVAFRCKLETALERIDALAEKYNRVLLLEYFGSNVNFHMPLDWINTISDYKNLGILVDTGHLFFASVIWSFDFIEALTVLSKSAQAFHLWTTRGDKAYGDSEFYQEYKHVSVHLDQCRETGWAFNSRDVLEIVLNAEKPIVIEASPLYLGEKYYQNGIRSVVEYATKC